MTMPAPVTPLTSYAPTYTAAPPAPTTSFTSFPPATTYAAPPTYTAAPPVTYTAPITPGVALRETVTPGYEVIEQRQNFDVVRDAATPEITIGPDGRVSAGTLYQQQVEH